MDRVLNGADGGVADDAVFHSNETDQKPQNAGAVSTSTAPKTGQSSPETADQSFGECPFCSGFRVEYEHVNEATGEVTDQSFTRPCRRTRCPVCGEINEPYRASYGQHVADLVRRLGAHPSEVKFVSVSLLREWADEAGIGGWDDSYQVLTGDGGPWSKALRRLRSRDPQLVFVGTISARPSDGRAHAHLVLVSRLSIDQIREAVIRFPLDGHVKTPAPTDSAEKFAANCAEYAFENHAHAPSARFTASRRHGAGYYSETARARRRAAVERKETEGQPAREGVEQTNDVGRDSRPPDTSNNGGETGDLSGEKDSETPPRGPPVDLRGQTFRTREGAFYAVKHYLSRRVGGAVHVNGLGRADLLQVKGEGDDLRCVVAPEITDRAVTVVWSEIYTRNVPTVGTPDSTSTDADRSMRNAAEGHEQGTDAKQPGPLERLRRARENADSDRVVSRFTHERHDGTRKVTEKRADGTVNTFTVDPTSTT